MVICLTAYELIGLLETVISKRPQLPLTTETLVLVTVIAPIIEEIIFRVIPLSVTIFIFKTSWPILVVAIVSSFIFGHTHGGYEFIPIQGVLGITLCVVFFKCGGLQKKKIKATGATMLTHSIYNGIVFLSVYIESI